MSLPITLTAITAWPIGVCFLKFPCLKQMFTGFSSKEGPVRKWPWNTKRKSGHSFNSLFREKSLVSIDVEIKAIPSFDLILLGVGKDGHTASLFPGDPALMEKKHMTAYVPKPGLAPEFPRITMTLPLINQADCVLFLVSGAEKKEVIKAILHESDAGRYRYPAAHVNPKGKIFWFIC